MQPETFNTQPAIEVHDPAVPARANVIANKNLTPGDTPADWDRPSGMRMGAIEVTRLGMREADMDAVAGFIARMLVEKQAPEDVMEDVQVTHVAT